jgi:hypothetical protein
MATAVKALEELSQDPEARWMARDREDSAHFYRMGLERSRQQGRAEHQKETITELCASYGIELTDARLASLDDPATNLHEIQSVLIRERRWP